jgi:hypothetical protein
MTQPYQFEEPEQRGAGDRFTADDAQNRRVIVVPVEYVPEIRTSRGDTTDAIKLNVVDLQGGFNPQTGQDDPPQAYHGTLWFGGRLIGAFRNGIGKSFIGYVAKVPVQGGFKAWQFHSLTQDPQTVQLATSWLQANPDFMEGCRNDVEMAARYPTQQQQPMQQQAQPAQQWGTGQGQWNQAQQWQAQQPPQPPPYQQPGPTPVPPGQPQGPAPMPPVATPSSMVQPPLPPPLSAPPAQQSPAPMQQPPAPTSPAQQLPPPGGQTVMQRLQAQRETDPGQPPPSREEAGF